MKPSPRADEPSWRNEIAGPRPLRGGGFSLLEMLLSMAILSLVLMVLAQALDSALSQWTAGSGGASARAETRSAMEWIRADLAAAVMDRPALAPLPNSASARERELFGGRWILPVEINRTQGQPPAGASFLNAEPGFDQLALAIRHGDEICLGGYYVASTRDSPLASGSRLSMKLHRHFRPGGKSPGAGRSQGYLMAASHLVNDARGEPGPGEAFPAGQPNPAALRQGRFRNAGLPFLFGQRMADPGRAELLPGAQPWPSWPRLQGALPDLPSPPPRYPVPSFTAEQWADPQDEIHETLFPDEAVAWHVVEFRCVPRRRVTLESGDEALLDAAGLNAWLGWPGEEWPALVRPDFVEVTLSVVPPEIAARLDTESDWKALAGGGDGPARSLLERHKQTTRLRLPFGPSPLR